MALAAGLVQHRADHERAVGVDRTRDVAEAARELLVVHDVLEHVDHHRAVVGALDGVGGDIALAEVDIGKLRAELGEENIGDVVRDEVGRAERDELVGVEARTATDLERRSLPEVDLGARDQTAEDLGRLRVLGFVVGLREPFVARAAQRRAVFGEAVGPVARRVVVALARVPEATGDQLLPRPACGCRSDRFAVSTTQNSSREH